MLHRFASAILLLFAFVHPAVAKADGVDLEVIEDAAFARPTLRSLVLERLPPFRERMIQLAKKRDIQSVLGNAEVQKQICGDIRRLVGAGIPVGTIAAAYETAVKSIDTRAMQACNISRVQLYSGLELKEKLRNGAIVPYFSYDRQNDMCSWDWNVESARLRNDTPDVPFVVIVTNRAQSDEEILGHVFEVYEDMLTSTINDHYGVYGYRVIKSVASYSLYRQAPNLPVWLREGIVGAVSIHVLSGMIGTKKALDAFGKVHVEGERLSSPNLQELYLWEPRSASPSTNAAYVRASTQRVLSIANVAGYRWIPFCVAALSKAEKVMPADVDAAMSEATGGKYRFSDDRTPVKVGGTSR
ncbi:hypothetical protein DB347_17995 [Opitutaceae bacterium EW11]|nr:hypothetical protein DB347_17995 [Opitutaceae bacterium EW11]